MKYDTIYGCLAGVWRKKIILVKKVYDTMRDFVYDTKRGCNFLAKIAKKGRMTQKCMTQNVRPFLLVMLMVVLFTNQFNFCFRAFRKISPGRRSLLRNL